MKIRKKFRFEAAHRLPFADSTRCRGIHGHSYVVEVMVDDEVDYSSGMVMDFGVLKNLIGLFIDSFDHSLILGEDDSLLDGSSNEENYIFLSILNPRFIITPYTPTAEMMAAHIYWYCVEKMRLKVSSVRVHETETGWAECDTILPVAFDRAVFSDRLKRADAV